MFDGDQPLYTTVNNQLPVNKDNGGFLEDGGNVKLKYASHNEQYSLTNISTGIADYQKLDSAGSFTIPVKDLDQLTEENEWGIYWFHVNTDKQKYDVDTNGNKLLPKVITTQYVHGDHKFEDSNLIITSLGDDSNITFTIKGYQSTGPGQSDKLKPIEEIVQGTNGLNNVVTGADANKYNTSSVLTKNKFHSVTDIITSGATADKVLIGRETEFNSAYDSLPPMYDHLHGELWPSLFEKAFAQLSSILIPDKYKIDFGKFAAGKGGKFNYQMLQCNNLKHKSYPT